jgi:hypothetical protein
MKVTVATWHSALPALHCPFVDSILHVALTMGQRPLLAACWFGNNPSKAFPALLLPLWTRSVCKVERRMPRQQIALPRRTHAEPACPAQRGLPANTHDYGWPSFRLFKTGA